MMAEEQGWPFIASIIYTAAWSISFYGQIYENYRNKSVEGFQLNYLIMNISGYTLYGMYSTMGYFFHEQGAGTVVIADLFFVYHALLMVFILTLQVLYYPRGKNRISTITIVLCIFIWFVVLVQILFSKFWHYIPETTYWNPVSCMGYGKLVLSFLKYSPAVYWNFKRKSTKGWSIFNILLDLVGAAFSIASGSLSVSNGLNVTKMVLALLTIFYDSIFVFQHYVLYRKRAPRSDEELLLPASEGS